MIKIFRKHKKFHGIVDKNFAANKFESWIAISIHIQIDLHYFFDPANMDGKALLLSNVCLSESALCTLFS